MFWVEINTHILYNVVFIGFFFDHVFDYLSAQSLVLSTTLKMEAAPSLNVCHRLSRNAASYSIILKLSSNMTSYFIKIVLQTISQVSSSFDSNRVICVFCILQMWLLVTYLNMSQGNTTKLTFSDHRTRLWKWNLGSYDSVYLHTTTYFSHWQVIYNHMKCSTTWSRDRVEKLIGFQLLKIFSSYMEPSCTLVLSVARSVSLSWAGCFQSTPYHSVTYVKKASLHCILVSVLAVRIPSSDPVFLITDRLCQFCLTRIEFSILRIESSVLRNLVLAS